MAELDDFVNPPRTTNPHEQESISPFESTGELAAILDRYMSDLQAGKGPDKDELLAAHPDLASQLEACLGGIEFIHRATGPATQEPAILGDFRIIRELGRGGMGVVYEAEQTSLRRHVALKVLRFGVVADEEAMKRFQREAETVARLHHTNIVPIFAVGSEQGVHYYAMQLIAGRSLADVQAESRRAGTLLPAEEIARWGLQAAEALGHAHQRGVIHRDIKPSNLLLDTDGVVWLTDFGLAKRADEASLTLHGTLMGTPRYMSPEQAASLQQPVDGRTDLYSLGASLYELATGCPLFAPAAAHVVIAQILTEEPARPRQLRPALPRDLETIILTCLAKEPAKRYQSARALASDLLAVIEGRPIQARRAPLLERVGRYVRQRRKTLKGAGLAAAATVLLMIGAFGAWRYYSDWRLGRILLTTDGPSLTAQVLPEASDEPIGEPFSIGAHSVVSLPAGDYRLRVQAPGLMGQTYRVALNRGETRTHRVTIDDNLLLAKESIAFSPIVTALPPSTGKADFIEWTGGSLIRRDGSTGKPIWSALMRGLLPGRDQKPPGTLIEPAPDLDGDGTGDLVWAMQRSPTFLAYSGKDGSLLWTYTANADGKGGPDLVAPATPEKRSRVGRVVGEPRVADVDGNGLPDLIAEFAVFDDPLNLMNLSGEPGGTEGKAEAILSGRRVVVAVSGRSGKELWNHVIDQKPVSLPGETFDRGITDLRQPSGWLMAVVDGSKWIGLDPATGRPKGPAIDLGFTPVQPVQYAELDGDGTMEILALEPGQGREPFAAPTLAAVSTATGKRLWIEKLLAHFKPQEGVPAREWLLAADLDGDGRAEVVVPDIGSLPPRNLSLYGGVRLLDGRNGQTRWVRHLWPGMISRSDSLAHLLVAPDLDADGTRDLVVVSRFSGREANQQFIGKPPEAKHVFVDVLSGKDGRRLWEWHAELTNAETTPIWPAFWWGRGPDGWPMLAVPIGGLPPGVAPKHPDSAPDPPVVHLLAAATGQEAHTIHGLSWARTADLDGDGLADLWGSVQDKLRAFRADAPEAWRALGRLQPAGDLDGDGMTDVLSNDLEPPRPSSGWDAKTDSRTALARSGRDGRILWRTLLNPWEDWSSWGEWTQLYAFHPLTLPGGDLDGDGSPDVLVRRGAGGQALNGNISSTFPLQALSGRTGRLLWSAGSAGLVPPSGSRRLGAPYIEGIDARVADPHGLPDVLVLYRAGFVGGSIPAPGFDKQSRLALVAGCDGRVLRDVLLADHNGGMTRLMGFVHEFADLDGDGNLEIVLLLQSKAASGPTPDELRVLSFANGETRWIHPLDPGAAASPAFVVGDLDGDRHSEVVVREQPRRPVQAGTEVTALDGLTGTPLWTWRGGEAGDESGQKPALCLADFEGSGRREVCVIVGDAPGPRRVVILDAKGHQRASRDLTPVTLPTLISADVDGDGRDELLLHDAGRLCACRGDLTDVWSWRTGDPIREVIPASPGRAATVILSPSLGLAGATGRPIWSIGPVQSILRASDDKSLPRALAGPDGATICRVAMPTTAEGPLPGQGLAARPSAFRDDPRWLRPLPWVGPVEPYANPLVQLAMGATLINVCIPVAILWLATRRRFWSVQLLLALPAMVAFPLVGFSTAISLFPDRPQPTVRPWWAVPLGIALWSMSGLPIVVYTAALGSALVRRRWWRMGLLVSSTLLAAILIGAIMLRSDTLAKPLIEHYNWSGWHQVVYLGAYAVGALALLARWARGVARLASRLIRRARAVVSTES
jgi:outer membrane protein assembly factor BamB